MKSIIVKNIVFLLALLGLLRSYLAPNILPGEYNFIVHFNILIHVTAVFYAMRNFAFQKVPIIFFVSCFNLYQYGIVLLLIPMEDFQLGIFNYDIMYILAWVFGLFYLAFFAFQLYFQKKIHLFVQNKALKYDEKRLRILLLLFYLFSLFVKLPISGLDQIFEYLTVGAFFVGYMKRQNSLIENLIFFVILSYSIVLQLITGLIFTIVFFGVFLFSVYLIYGRGNKRGSIFVGAMLLFVGGFSVLFSEVKIDYRIKQQSLNSVNERIDLIYGLIVNRRDEKRNYLSYETNIRETTAWRLSYSLSAFSLVYTKTPSKVDYWYGVSYFPIVTKFIPRFLWPNKPKEYMGQMFGHTYNILDDSDSTTSMNTPMITESYMNFGYFGLIFVILIFALLIARIRLAINSKINYLNTSLIDNLVISELMVFFIQTESNFSMLLGKIFTLLFISFVLKMILFGYSKFT